MAIGVEQRQAYLRELGIQTYFPRRALIGAKPSAAYASNLLAAPEHRERIPHTTLHEHAARNETSVMTRETMAEVWSEPLRASTKETGSVSTPAAPAIAIEPEAMAPATATLTSPEENPRFAFAYFPINEQLAVINELPWAKSAAVSPACRNLLAAILNALAVPCDEKDLTSMLFTWPMSDEPGIEHTAENARHTLDGFLTRRFKLRPVRYLLVLAEQSGGYVFPGSADWQQSGLQRHPHHDVEVIVTRSLNAMEAVPDIKRSVWQALQPLRAALNSPSGNAR